MEIKSNLTVENVKNIVISVDAIIMYHQKIPS